ncbi:MAG TPA: DUF805 domain-containing protein [Gemmatimonadetes bacterium]|nr:DUF805 domain-containing protein [Gemmatimonadota bacterium]
MGKINLWTLYTSLQGRISKRTFLLWVFLPIAVTRFLASTIDTALYGVPSSLSELWPGVAGTVKRLHDLEINAKHVGGMYGAWAVAIALFLFNRTGSNVVTPGLMAAMVTAVLAIIYTLYVFIPCCFKPGIEGPNSYGPDPLEE